LLFAWALQQCSATALPVMCIVCTNCLSGSYQLGIQWRYG